jgi:hypothetical protein
MFFPLQTQEFQGIAKGLERWIEGMNDALHQLERIAARVKLIEPQIEGFGVSNLKIPTTSNDCLVHQNSK